MNTKKIKELEKKRGKISSKIGGWKMGDDAYTYGHAILEELLFKNSYFDTLILNITGEIPSKALSKWIEGSFICLSWPDSRIWCNQVGAFAGSARCRPSAGITAGLLAADSQLYAQGAIRYSAEFIQSALRKKIEGDTLQSIVETFKQNNSSRHFAVGIPGYARPIAKGDERVERIKRFSAQLGFEQGRHLQLALEIEKYIKTTFDESLNFLGYCTAFLSDQGIPIKAIERIYSLWVTAGVAACYSEYHDAPPDTFLPIRCDDIKYTGPSPRSVPPT